MISLRISIVAAVVVVGVLAVYVLQVVASNPSPVGASFDSIALDVSGQDTGPEAMLFNDDGTVLYVLGNAGDDINAYNLTTAYDISSASFDSIALDVSGEDTDPMHMLFNDDGTVLYVLGRDGDDINAYTLTTAYDISSATFDSVALDVSQAMQGNPYAMIFNDDGSALYVTGFEGAIVRYNLSTNYDISTAGTGGKVYDVGGQETNPIAMEFSDDGYVLYVLGYDSDDIYAYTLDVAYNISTASYDSVVLDASGEDTQPMDMIFNDDGTILYILGRVGDDINAYNLFSGSTTFTTPTTITEDASITGSLAKGAGTFVIDHPLDPENKLLYHSFVESPDVKNIYDGIVELDENGEATITLPDYFEALNKNPRILLTAVGQPAPNLYVEETVQNNQFSIAGGPAGARVSWQVTGIRHDPYIEANPIIPEVEKGPNELVDKGEYLFPGYRELLLE